MSKLTEKKFNEYKEINKSGGVNGFKIDLHKILYQFTHGDEYPQFKQVLFNDDNIQLILKVSYFKFYGGSAEYTIEINEFKKSKDSIYMSGGSLCYNKTLFKAEEEKSRFSFKYLLELCNKYNIDELKKDSLKNYNDYKLKNNLKVVI